MSEFIELVRAEEGRAAAALEIAEDIERRARCTADIERRRVLALRQFILCYTPLISPPEQAPPAKTESDRRSGDDVDGQPLQPETANADPEAAGGPPTDPLRSEAASHEDAETAASGTQSGADETRQEALSEPSADEGSQPILPETANETAGGFPVAAAPVKAEQQGVGEATREAKTGTTLATVVTGGESAADADKPGEALASPAPAVTLKDRILACHAEHPYWTVQQAADHLGAKANSVSAYCSVLKIKFATAPKPPHDFRKFVRKETVEPGKPAPEPEPEHPPATVLGVVLAPADDGTESHLRKYGEPEKPAFEVGDPDEDAIEEMPAPVVSPVYRLMSPSGQWLHRDMGRTTYKVSDAWQGNAQDMERVFKGNPRLKVYEAMKA